MFFTSLAASRIDMPVPPKRACADKISFVMVFRILLSIYFYPHFYYSFIKRVNHERKNFCAGLN